MHWGNTTAERRAEPTEVHWDCYWAACLDIHLADYSAASRADWKAGHWAEPSVESLEQTMAAWWAAQTADLTAENLDALKAAQLAALTDLNLERCLVGHSVERWAA